MALSIIFTGEDRGWTLKNHGVRDTSFAVSNTPFLCSVFPLGGDHLRVPLVLFPSSLLGHRLQELCRGPLRWPGVHLHLSMSVLVSMFRHSSMIFTPVKVYFHRISLPLLFLEGHIFLLCDQRNFWLSQRLEVVLLINKSIALLKE